MEQTSLEMLSILEEKIINLIELNGKITKILKNSIQDNSELQDLTNRLNQEQGLLRERIERLLKNFQEAQDIIQEETSDAQIIFQ